MGCLIALKTWVFIIEKKDGISLMKNTVDYQGEKYEIKKDYGDLKSLLSPSGKVFLVIPKRGILIPASNEESDFHIAHGNLYLHGVSFKAGRKERRGDNITATRNCTTTRYNNCTVLFFMDDGMTEILEILCPQFG